MKVVVAGATGFLGRYCVRALLESGHEVVVLVRNPRKARELFPVNVDVAVANPEDESSVRGALSPIKCHALVNLVGIIQEKGKETFENVHYHYFRLLLEAEKGPQFQKVVLVSALGTHPDAPSRYHKTKLMAEMALIGSSYSYAILRPSFVLGPEQMFLRYVLGSSGVLSRLMPLPGGGRIMFQPVDVRDVACSVVGALDAQDGIYEICGERVVTFRQLIQDLCRLAQKKKTIVGVPPAIAYAGAWVLEKFSSSPPVTRDQLLMMWRDNIGGLDAGICENGVEVLCKRKPIPYEESLSWAVSGFLLGDTKKDEA